MKKIKNFTRLTVTAFCLLLHGKLAAQQTKSPDRNLTGFEDADAPQPLWEYGVGGGLIEVPNYPASSERNFIALALPYFIYRGDILRIGGGNARAVVSEVQDLEIDVSVGGAFSADSEDNSARDGMPDLDFLFELGPRVNYRVRDFDFEGGGHGRLNLIVPVRGVFSTDFKGVEGRGYVFQPQISYQQRGVLSDDTGLSVSLSAVFATEKLHDYFYQVDQTYATATRPEFDASGGYLGTELSAGLSFPLMENIRGFAGGTVRFHQGAENEDSPLFEDDVTYSVGVGFVWRLGTSDRVASW
ncbi:MAG: MipA/OmpV family protein [Alteromonadaceae bacterium]|nr:MipA/OmpV family protein [Alteromonadaceae bacterium]